jgi:hypothetical protein
MLPGFAGLQRGAGAFLTIGLPVLAFIADAGHKIKCAAGNLKKLFTSP